MDRGRYHTDLARRGAVITTIIAGWAMVPWKIVRPHISLHLRFLVPANLLQVYSASSLQRFMSGLAAFLAPISAIMACDYWLVKHRAVDVPSLYRRHARYRYQYGINWRAAVAFLVSIAPNLPGLAAAVNTSIELSDGIKHVWDMYYIWGLSSAFFVYWALNYFWPAEKTIISRAIHQDVEVMDGMEVVNDGVHTPEPIGEVEKKVSDPVVQTV